MLLALKTLSARAKSKDLSAVLVGALSGHLHDEAQPVGRIVLNISGLKKPPRLKIDTRRCHRRDQSTGSSPVKDKYVRNIASLVSGVKPTLERRAARICFNVALKVFLHHTRALCDDSRHSDPYVSLFSGVPRLKPFL